MSSIQLTHHSDVLCVWAYVAQIRLDELRRHFPGQIVVRPRFVPVFGDTPRKIGEAWQARGGFPAYATHVAGVVARFDHVRLHGDAWSRVRPASSLVPHLVARAAGLLDLPEVEGRPVVEALAWRLRVAFFEHARDVGALPVALAVAEEMGLPADALRARIDDGSAWAELHRDHAAVEEDGVRGSPTFVLNDRRQILYGNVGYRILEANVHELLRDAADQASWC